MNCVLADIKELIYFVKRDMVQWFCKNMFFFRDTY